LSNWIFSDSQDQSFSLPFGENHFLESVGFLNLLSQNISPDLSYEFYVDNLCSMFPLATLENRSLFIFAQLNFRFLYSDSHIIDVRITGSELTLSDSPNFSLNVASFWQHSPIPAERRLVFRFNDGLFFHRVHYHSLLRMVLLAVIVWGLIYGICRQILLDSAKSEVDDRFDWQKSADRGWKMLHGDVFRTPPRSFLFSLLVGGGCAVICVCLTFALFASLSSLDKPRHYFVILGLILWVLAAFIGGLGAVSCGNSFGEGKWLRLALGSVLAVGAPIFCIVFLISLHGATAESLAVVSPVAVCALALIIVLPAEFLSGCGGFLARKYRLFATLPVNLSLVPRLIPTLPFFLKFPFVSISIGFFNVSSISTELLLLLTAFWKRELFTAFQMLLAALALLFALSAGFAVIAVYLRLQHESYHWHWFAFASPAVTGIFVLLFGVYFRAISNIPSDAFTTTLFAGMSILMALIIALFCGTAGVIGANWFVRLIFSNLKLE
jgi:transmembrane 9 superfamily protein 3